MGRVSGTIVVEYEVLVMSCTVKLWSDRYQEVVMASLCNENKVVSSTWVAILSPIAISKLSATYWVEVPVVLSLQIFLCAMLQ